MLKYVRWLVLTCWPLFQVDRPYQGQQFGRRSRSGLKRIQIRIFSLITNRTFKPHKNFMSYSQVVAIR